MFEIPDLDRRGLRKFGFTTAGIVVGLFGLLLPLLRGKPLPVWPWAIGAFLAGWAAVAPGSLVLVYRPWMKIGGVLGWINTRIILGVVFLLIIVPLGRLLRLMHERKVARMTQGFDASSETYWTVPPLHRSNLEKPF